MITSTGTISQADFRNYVELDSMYGDIHSISGVHGNPNETIHAIDHSIYLNDIKAFGATHNMHIYDFNKLNKAERNRLLNLGEGHTTISGFCNSDLCLLPYK